MFFAVELLWPAFVAIVALDIAVAVTLVRFWKVSRVAGTLFVSYLAWVLSATVLDAAIAALN